MAMDPTDHAITPALPVPPAAPQPSLFSEIHASQHPTTNLEHLSEALDHLGPQDELDNPLPEESESLAPPEPALPIHHAVEGNTERLEPPPTPEITPAPSRRPLALLLVAALIGGLWFGINRLRQARPAPPAPPDRAEPAPDVKPAVSSPEAVKPVPAPEPEGKPIPEPPQAVPPGSPAQKKEPPSVPSKADRLQTIIQGDWKKAVSQGSLHRKALQGRWTLRLEIACQGTTIQHAADLLKSQDPDLFLMPMAMRDGKTCYQIFFGSFESEAAAKAAAKKLPPPFLAEGNRPMPFRVAQIPDRQ